MGEAIKIKQFYYMIFYLIISGFLVPTFGSFNYYFLLDVVKISKFTYAMLTVLTFVNIFIGTFIYKQWLKECEFRRLIMSEPLIQILMAPLTLILVLRYTVQWGIPDLLLIIFIDIP